MNISSFRELPDVIKNILIINCLLFLATMTLESHGVDLTKILGLHQFQSPNFRPHQLITHMFMHGSPTHLFLNMFAIWMFGKVLENVWGGKRFLKFYIITGLGAALIYIGYIQFQVNNTYKKIDNKNEIEICEVMVTHMKKHTLKKWIGGPCEDINIDILEYIKQNDIVDEKEYINQMRNGEKYFDKNARKLSGLIHTPMVGASGALFGILLAFGMLFPNTLLYIYFALPIKAKYFVMLYGAIELFLGFRNLPGDNIAHFAHLGGMIAGYILLKYWKQDRNTFY